MSNEFNPLEPEFVSWGKIPRLFRNVVVTEKLDGTNAAIGVLDDGTVYAQSRKKIITADADNSGFGRYVENNDALFREHLGPGLHFGEWWGQGVQRNYGQTQKFFSLFNTNRWGLVVTPGSPLHAAGVRVVPVLYEGPFSEQEIKDALHALHVYGSYAAPGFMNAEGVIIYHTAANSMFKVTLKDDEKPKGSTE